MEQIPQKIVAELGEKYLKKVAETFTKWESLVELQHRDDTAQTRRRQNKDKSQVSWVHKFTNISDQHSDRENCTDYINFGG